MNPIFLATAWLVATPGVQGPGPEGPRAVDPPPAPTTIENNGPPAPHDLHKTPEARIADLEVEVQRLQLRMFEDQPHPPAEGGSVSANVFNPSATVIGNAWYRYDDREILDGEERVDNAFNLREIELDLRAAVDPFADGVLILAFHAHSPGAYQAEVEESYVNIKRLPLPGLDDPPLGLKLKVGRFRTETGRINRLHLHDLPQMTRPIVTQEFFGEDGFIANGVSAQSFIPTPFDDESAVELSAQALAGGGTTVAAGPPRSPAFVGNLRWFRMFSDAHSFDLSLILHFGRTDPTATLSAFTYSADFLYRWRPLRGGEFNSFLLGGQVFYSRRAFLLDLDTDGDGVPDTSERRDTAPLGYFAWAQVQLSRRSYLGTRWDDTATIVDAAIRRRAVTGYLTWYASEFLRFRLGYEHRIANSAATEGGHSAFAELVFIFGAHPPEPFWVNK